jgi:hypothetical protein
MTAPNPTRAPQARPNLPRGLKWSNVWKVDGVFHEAPAGVEMPVDEQWQITGKLWVCPVEGCDHEKWTFDDTTSDNAPCCTVHPTRLAHTPLNGGDPDPVKGARARAAAHFAGIYQRRRDAAVQAATARASAAARIVEDATRRTAADMRGHVPSIAATGLVLAAGAPLVVADPILAAVAGVTAGPVALAAYVVAMLVRRMRKVAARDEKQARRDRRVARHVASGVLATGLWLVASAAASLLPTFLHVSFTLIFGLLLAFAVNNAHWQDLWATRHRLKEMARLKAEAERRRLEDEARRAAERPAQPTPTTAPAPDESDPLIVGQRMAAEWLRVSHLQAAGGSFPAMPRTWINPVETKPITAPVDGKTVRIGWEFFGQAEPGALVARAGMQAPVTAARDWLAAVLFDGRHNPSTVSLVDRPGGQANRFTLMITDSVPLGEPVRWQGKAGVKRLPDGTILVHRGRSIDGNDVHHPLLVPGQAFGGLVVGTRGGGKTAGTILHLLNCLAAQVFPTLFDPKQLVDYADFIGLFPIGVTQEHRDVITDWLIAERKRRERLMARRPVTDEFGRQVHGESQWNPADGAAVSHNWEEFHDLAQDEQWVTGRLTNHLRFERAVWMGGRLVSQGGGLADWGNSVLRGLLGQTEMTTYRMDDHQARLAGRKDGSYTASDLPPLAGMCLVTGPEMSPLPLRDAYVPRKVNDPGSVFNVLYGRGAEKVPQFELAPIPAEMAATMRRTGLQELWDRAKGEGGLERLLADAEDEEYGGPSPAPVSSAGVVGGQAMQAEDVVLAIAYRDPGLGPTAISRHSVWLKPVGGGKIPALSTITKPGAKFETDGLLTREGGYRVTEKGKARAAALSRTLFGDPVGEERAQEQADEEQA